jgi:hypothetical protein
MPEEKAKAEAPAPTPAPVQTEISVQDAAAPAALPPLPAESAPGALPEAAEKKAKGQILVDQPPPTADDLPVLEPLRKEDRERALSRMMVTKQTAPAPVIPSTGNNASAATPAPAPAAPAVAAPATPAPDAVESAAAGSGPQAAAAAPEKAAEQRKVAGRVFLRADVGWVDQAYKGEVLTPLEVESDEYKQLLPTHPPLAQVVELGGTITLRIDGVWRDLKTGRPITESK